MQNIISVSLIDTTRNNPTPEFFAITTKEKLRVDIENHMRINQHKGPILFVAIDKNAKTTTFEATTTEQLYLGNQQITQYPSGNFDFITAAFNLILHNQHKDVSLYFQNDAINVIASINNLYEDEDLTDHTNHTLNKFYKTKQKITFTIEDPSNQEYNNKIVLITKTQQVIIKQL